jgi:hypothetical protein
MREGANLAVSQEPGYFRNRQLAIPEVALGESSPQFLLYSGKGYALSQKQAREGAATETKLTRNLRSVGFAVRKQRQNHPLYISTRAVAMRRPTGQRFIGIPAQQFIQVRVGPDYRKRGNLFRKNDLVRLGIELDITRQKRPIFGGDAVAMMSDRHSRGCQPGVCQLPAYTHQRREPELNLMAIRASIHVQVFKRDDGCPA